MSVPGPNYPVFLDLRDKAVLVVGAGPVGTRRAERLVLAGARVRVVAPRADPRLRALADAGSLAWEERPFVPTDLDGVWFAHACTGLAAVDAEVAQAGEDRRVWTVRASSARRSAAWTAATGVVEDVQVAVSAGRDPGRAVAVKDGLLRALQAGEVSLRPHRRRPPAAPTGPPAADTPFAGPLGRVALVGAGPGDPDLMTLRARRLLRRADVVVVDRLVPAAVLTEVGPEVVVVDAGKRPGRHTLTQEEINRVLIEHALAGADVVRLKGGDPFVLGRGGEEALACLEAGIAVEVVPGVTSALSVPAAAGIPVTHRGVATSFVVASGHAGVPDLMARAQAAPSDATLVLLMAVARLAEIADALVGAGRRPATPVAVIERGWTDRQRTIVGSLADIAERTEAAGAGPPAVVVVGDVVALRPWLGDLARPSGQAGFAAAPRDLEEAAGVPAAVTT